MIYEYYKYKNIESFIKNQPSNKNSKEYTVLFKCDALDEKQGKRYEFKNNCFGCLFCILESNDLKEKYFNHFDEDEIKDKAKAAFKGRLVNPPSAKYQLRNPFKSLEHFTKISETENIQPWAAGLLNHSTSNENRIGMEINVPNELYKRDGRLDICAITEEYLMVLESKVSLEEALKDERFIEQYEKYYSEINKASDKFLLAVLIGGKETDLLPSEHQQCTGRVGDISKRFYNIIDNYRIPFISANALWCLTLKYIINGDNYSWDKFIPQVFSDENCIGLLSAGKVIKVKDGYKIEKL